MSVDWFVCRCCGDTFPDCGECVFCDCGEHWCSDKCANTDGYQEEGCKLGYEVEYGKPIEGCKKQCCNSCENYIERSCKYCRKEDFSDYVLLKYALQLLNITRNELIEKYKDSMKD